MKTIPEGQEAVAEENGEAIFAEPVELKPPKSGIFQTSYKMRLELAAFLIYFGVNLSSIIFQDQVLYQTCTVVYGYNTTVCEDLGSSKAKTDPEIQAVENIVQPYAAKIFMAETFVKAIVPAILALFIGAWTDKFGRKPIILITIAGYLAFFGIKTIVAGISLGADVNPWIYIIASIPLSFCGGDVALQTAIYCYIADLTTLHERPIKMCIMTGIMAFSGFIGQLVSSYLYEATNSCVLFAISTAAQLISLVFVVFVIKESIKSDQLSKESKIKGLFDGQLLKDMFNTVFKKREHFETVVIWFIIISLTSIAIDSAGLSDVFFLFLRKKFGWTVQEFTTFNSIRIVITFIGATVGTITLQIILRIRLTIVTLISFGSYLALASCYASAMAPWYIYLGVTITCLSGVASPMGQSILTNTVPPSDIGKVFTVMSALQAIAPLIASPLYTFVYNSTFESYPGAYNLISVGLYLLCMFFIGFVHVLDLYYPNVNVAKTQ